MVVNNQMSWQVVGGQAGMLACMTGHCARRASTKPSQAGSSSQHRPPAQLTCCSAAALLALVRSALRRIASTAGAAASRTLSTAAGSAPDSRTGRVCRLHSRGRGERRREGRLAGEDFGSAVFSSCRTQQNRTQKLSSPFNCSPSLRRQLPLRLYQLLRLCHRQPQRLQKLGLRHLLR